jgi:hypothetical protein
MVAPPADVRPPLAAAFAQARPQETATQRTLIVFATLFALGSTA